MPQQIFEVLEVDMTRLLQLYGATMQGSFTSNKSKDQSRLNPAKTAESRLWVESVIQVSNPF